MLVPAAWSPVEPHPHPGQPYPAFTVWSFTFLLILKPSRSCPFLPEVARWVSVAYVPQTLADTGSESLGSLSGLVAESRQGPTLPGCRASALPTMPHGWPWGGPSVSGGWGWHQQRVVMGTHVASLSWRPMCWSRALKASSGSRPGKPKSSRHHTFFCQLFMGHLYCSCQQSILLFKSSANHKCLKAKVETFLRQVSSFYLTMGRY